MVVFVFDLSIKVSARECGIRLYESDFTTFILYSLFWSVILYSLFWSVKKCCTVHKCLKTIFWVKKQLIAEKDGGGEDLGGGRRFNINL